MKKTRRVAAPKLSADELARLEEISRRYQESELAWLKMVDVQDGDESWTNVEEHMLARGRSAHHGERRWKYFSK